MAAPDGRVWVVRRRWTPRLSGETAGERFQGRLSVVAGNLRGGSPLHPWFGIFRYGCLAPVGLVLIVTLVVVFVLAPLVVAIAELLVVLVLGASALVARVVFRRPWAVEAVADDGEILSWRVVGWRASRAKVGDTADHLATGLRPSP